MTDCCSDDDDYYDEHTDCLCEKCDTCEYYCDCPSLCKHDHNLKESDCSVCDEEFRQEQQERQRCIGPGCLDITMLSSSSRVSSPCISYPNCEECKRIRGEE